MRPRGARARGPPGSRPETNGFRGVEAKSKFYNNCRACFGPELRVRIHIVYDLPIVGLRETLLRDPQILRDVAICDFAWPLSRSHEQAYVDHSTASCQLVTHASQTLALNCVQIVENCKYRTFPTRARNACRERRRRLCADVEIKQIVEALITNVLGRVITDATPARPLAPCAIRDAMPLATSPFQEVDDRAQLGPPPQRFQESRYVSAPYGTNSQGTAQSVDTADKKR